MDMGGDIQTEKMDCSSDSVSPKTMVDTYFADTIFSMCSVLFKVENRITVHATIGVIIDGHKNKIISINDERLKENISQGKVEFIIQNDNLTNSSETETTIPVAVCPNHGDNSTAQTSSVINRFDNGHTDNAAVGENQVKDNPNGKVEHVSNLSTINGSISETEKVSDKNGNEDPFALLLKKHTSKLNCNSNRDQTEDILNVESESKIHTADNTSSSVVENVAEKEIAPEQSWVVENVAEKEIAPEQSWVVENVAENKVAPGTRDEYNVTEKNTEKITSSNEHSNDSSIHGDNFVHATEGATYIFKTKSEAYKGISDECEDSNASEISVSMLTGNATEVDNEIHNNTDESLPDTEKFQNSERSEIHDEESNYASELSVSKLAGNATEVHNEIHNNIEHSLSDTERFQNAEKSKIHQKNIPGSNSDSDIDPLPLLESIFKPNNHFTSTTSDKTNLTKTEFTISNVKSLSKDDDNFNSAEDNSNNSDIFKSDDSTDNHGEANLTNIQGNVNSSKQENVNVPTKEITPNKEHQSETNKFNFKLNHLKINSLKKQQLNNVALIVSNNLRDKEKVSTEKKPFNGSTSIKKKNDTSSKTHKSYKRRKPCGSCTNCKVSKNCGECGCCLNKSWKQRCQKRQCLTLKTKILPSMPSKETQKRLLFPQPRKQSEIKAPPAVNSHPPSSTVSSANQGRIKDCCSNQGENDDVNKRNHESDDDIEELFRLDNNNIDNDDDQNSTASSAEGDKYEISSEDKLKKVNSKFFTQPNSSKSYNASSTIGQEFSKPGCSSKGHKKRKLSLSQSSSAKKRKFLNNNNYDEPGVGPSTAVFINQKNRNSPNIVFKKDEQSDSADDFEDVGSFSQTQSQRPKEKKKGKIVTLKLDHNYTL